NTPDHIIGYLSHLRLRMEHQLCLEIPRLGELIAFRKVLDRIPPDVAMDEAFVEALVIQRGLQVRYAPEAVVFNMGPQTIADFVKVRRRNHAGHLHLKRRYGYAVSSLDSLTVGRIALLQVWGAARLVWVLMLLAGVEFLARFLGAYDYHVRRRRRRETIDLAWATRLLEQPAVDTPLAAVEVSGLGEKIPS
ncbi:MAG TPA: hypothetical protein VER55_11125, partial [Ardenticatenaceae bacterium]|nr:hypothetical protein [Ardenticatenaceae bacterium]